MMLLVQVQGSFYYALLLQTLKRQEKLGNVSFKSSFNKGKWFCG